MAKKQMLWSPKEILFLKRNYSSITLKNIAKKLNRTESSVWNKAATLRMRNYNTAYKKQEFWTPAEILFLKKNYPSVTLKDIAKKLKRTESAVWNKAAKLRIRNHSNAFKKQKFWTPAEILFLKKNYPSVDLKDIAKKLKRTEKAVAHEAAKQKISRGKTIEWKPNEIAYIKKWYGKKKPNEIAEHIKYTRAQVVGKANWLGLKMPPANQWKARETNYLRKNYQNKSYNEIAEHLKRSLNSVRIKAKQLKLKKNRSRNWPPREKKFIRKNYDKISNKLLAKKLKVSEASVYKIAKKMGLTKHTGSFSNEELRYIRKSYRKLNKVIAKKLKRSFASIDVLVFRKGWKK